MNKQRRGDYGNKPNTVPKATDVYPYDPNKGGKTDEQYVKLTREKAGPKAPSKR